MMKRIGKLLLKGVVLAVALVWMVTCTVTPELPPGVVKETHRMPTAKDVVTVDFYYPSPAPVEAPLVVVAHGFSRRREHMAGWGIALAQRGMVAAVLDQPKLAGHGRNGAAIAGLVRRTDWPIPVAVGMKRGLVGYSMGGLTTLLAAEAAPVEAWLGLDPVDFDQRGERLVAGLTMPGLALLAEPAPFNRDGNAMAMLRDYGGPLWMGRVIGAGHIDPESPTNWIGQLACGRWEAERHAAFLEQGVAFLEATLVRGEVEGFEAAWKADQRIEKLER